MIRMREKGMDNYDISNTLPQSLTRLLCPNISVSSLKDVSTIYNPEQTYQEMTRIPVAAVSS